MQYPKPTMRLMELVKGGYHGERELHDIYTTPGQTIARKMNPYKHNSPIVFDTEKLAKHIEKQCKLCSAHEIKKGGGTYESNKSTGTFELMYAGYSKE